MQIVGDAIESLFSIANHSYLHYNLRYYSINWSQCTMYVCVCKAVTDREIKKAAKRGATSLTELREQLGVASCCGSCASHAQELINDVHYTHDFKSDKLAYQIS